jgi:hypothetical protein
MEVYMHLPHASNPTYSRYCGWMRFGKLISAHPGHNTQKEGIAKWGTFGSLHRDRQGSIQGLSNWKFSADRVLWPARGSGETGSLWDDVAFPTKKI